MHYHKPPSEFWSPNEIASHLCSLGVDAKSDGERVRISVVVPEDRSWIGTVVDQALPGSTGEHTIEILFRPDVFIRNVSVKRDYKMLSNILHKEIDEALTRQGYLAMSDDMDFLIARSYCKLEESISELEAEIRLHKQNKQKLVESHDFDAAARTLGLEYNARNQLDVLVKKAVAAG